MDAAGEWLTWGGGCASQKEKLERKNENLNG
jgi:hypothetical protein